jgi:peroxiredoxin
MSDLAYPPETIEGWYALHSIHSFDRPAWRALSSDARDALLADGADAWCHATRTDVGWSAAIPLIGSSSDVLFMHFRPTLEAAYAAERRFLDRPIGDYFVATDTFVSVTEVAMYFLSAELVAEALARGGKVGDEVYRAKLATRVEAELAGAHVQKRLHPVRPPEMPYVSFYPMTKRRTGDDNWYALPIAERDRLMRSHGLTGRKFAGRVLQIVTGAIGFADWEWGVTLFAKDPLDLKRLVTEMRYDTASARYADFGPFYLGRVTDDAAWLPHVCSLDGRSF